jgi:hypothetical protein
MSGATKGTRVPENNNNAEAEAELELMFLNQYISDVLSLVEEFKERLEHPYTSWSLFQGKHRRKLNESNKDLLNECVKKPLDQINRILETMATSISGKHPKELLEMVLQAHLTLEAFVTSKTIVENGIRLGIPVECRSKFNRLFSSNYKKKVNDLYESPQGYGYYKTMKDELDIQRELPQKMKWLGAIVGLKIRKELNDMESLARLKGRLEALRRMGGGGRRKTRRRALRKAKTLRRR